MLVLYDELPRSQKPAAISGAALASLIGAGVGALSLWKQAERRGLPPKPAGRQDHQALRSLGLILTFGVGFLLPRTVLVVAAGLAGGLMLGVLGSALFRLWKVGTRPGLKRFESSERGGG